MAFKSNDPFAQNGRPYINAPPGVDAARKPPGSVTLPSPPSQRGVVLGRLAKAIARLPVSVDRSNGRELFLP
jgi:hypothetical protein